MNPLTDLPQIMIWERGRTTGTFLARFISFKFRRSTFVEQISFQAKLGSCAGLIEVYRLNTFLFFTNMSIIIIYYFYLLVFIN